MPLKGHVSPLTAPSPLGSPRRGTYHPGLRPGPPGPLGQPPCRAVAVGASRSPGPAGPGPAPGPAARGRRRAAPGAAARPRPRRWTPGPPTPAAAAPSRAPGCSGRLLEGTGRQSTGQRGERSGEGEGRREARLGRGGEGQPGGAGQGGWREGAVRATRRWLVPIQAPAHRPPSSPVIAMAPDVLGQVGVMPATLVGRGPPGRTLPPLSGPPCVPSISTAQLLPGLGSVVRRRLQATHLRTSGSKHWVCRHCGVAGLSLPLRPLAPRLMLPKPMPVCLPRWD